MGVKELERLDAWALSNEFKLAVYALIERHPEAKRDFRYHEQLCSALADAESDVAEGWDRRRAGYFRVFLDYAKASNSEARVRLQDGVDRGYFKPEEIVVAMRLGNRAAQ